MIEHVSGAIGALKILKDVRDAMNEAESDSKANEVAAQLNGVIISLHESIFEIQANHTALLDANRDLKEHVAKLEAARTKLDSYELNEIATGLFVYSLKSEVDSPEPPHHICANCYADDKASILRVRERDSGAVDCFCPRCKTTLKKSGKPRKIYNTLDRH